MECKFHTRRAKTPGEEGTPPCLSATVVTAATTIGSFGGAGGMGGGRGGVTAGGLVNCLNCNTRCKTLYDADGHDVQKWWACQ